MFSSSILPQQVNVPAMFNNHIVLQKLLQWLKEGNKFPMRIFWEVCFLTHLLHNRRMFCLQYMFNKHTALPKALTL